MSLKSISLMFFLLTSSAAYSSTISMALIISRIEEEKKTQYKKKILQERQPLFMQTEQQEQIFITTQAQCIRADDCDINQAYKQARYDILLSILALENHLEDLKQNTNGTCNKYEKTEAKNIKKRLVELLKSSHKDDY